MYNFDGVNRQLKQFENNKYVTQTDIRGKIALKKKRLKTYGLLRNNKAITHG